MPASTSPNTAKAATNTDSRTCHPTGGPSRVRPFCICGLRPVLYQSPPLNRRAKLLAACLALSLLFAGWTWFRPYEWGRDPGARYRIVHASLQRDHSFFWLGVYLKQSGSESHDLMKPVALVLADGREIDPAETNLEGNQEHPTSGIGLRFWLEEKDLAGPLRLKLNDGTLTVRKNPGPPAPGSSIRYFNTVNW
jgi:hypothetical protein